MSVFCLLSQYPCSIRVVIGETILHTDITYNNPLNTWPQHPHPLTDKIIVLSTTQEHWNTEFQKDVDQQSISWCLKYKEAMQVWQSLTVKAHFTLGKNKNKQIFMYLGYLLWWIFIYWAQKSSSLLSVI